MPVRFFVSKKFVGLLILLSSAAWASDNNVTIELSAMRLTQLVGYAGTSVTETTVSPFELKSGYTWPSGLYIGGNITSLQNVSAAGVDNISGLALVFGYRFAGFYVDASYYLISQLQNASNYIYRSGSSYGAELGYNVTLTGTFFLGAALAYKSFLWSEADAPNGTRILQNNTWIDMYPSVNIGFTF